MIISTHRLTKAAFLALIALIVFVLPGCGPTPAGTLQTSPVVFGMGTSPSPSESSPPGLLATRTIAPDQTPTADMRLKPEEWKKWPVVPLLSSKVLEIYRSGMGLGANPRAFSKVGDCQNIRAAFLGFYDQPLRYTLPERYDYLQETIDYFSGSFNRDGMAVKGGFNAATVLSPLWADPDFCLAGEAPLECEFRIHKPSLVLISLEVWFKDRTPESYAAYIRQIIEYALAHGVIPILSTKADNMEGDNSINLATAKLAYEYDLPLWNFWSAVQPLPDHGIDPARDGFHVSVEAWNVRSFTALQVLDAVRRYIVRGEATSASGEGGGVIEATDTPQTVSSPTAVNLQSLAGQVTAIQAGGRIYFGLARRSSSSYSQEGVFLLDLDSLTFSRFLPEGYDFQSGAADGVRILVNHSQNLSMVYLLTGALAGITPTFYNLSERGAYWLPGNDEVVFIESQPERNQIIRLGIQTGKRATLEIGEGNPIELYPSNDTGGVWWETGFCRLLWDCDRAGVRFNAWGEEFHTLSAPVQKPAFSPTGNFLAYGAPAASSVIPLHIVSLDSDVERTLELSGDHLLDLAWAPDGRHLAALTMVRSSYSGRASAIRVYVLNTDTWGIEELESLTGLNPQAVWSPDSVNLLILNTQPQTEGANALDLRIYHLENKQVVDLTQGIGYQSADYIVVTNGDWIPAPPKS